METNISYSIGVCSEFMRDKSAKKANLGIVIAPLHITSSSEGKLDISSGCNFFRSCHNVDCYYSVAARDINRPQPGK